MNQFIYRLRWFFSLGWRRDVVYGIKNLIRWFPVIWMDRDWDWYFMAVLMQKKAEQMAYLQRNHGVAEEREALADELDKLAENLSILTSEDGGNDDEDEMSAAQHAVGSAIATRLRYWWD